MQESMVMEGKPGEGESRIPEREEVLVALPDPYVANLCKGKRNISSFIATITFTETSLKITNPCTIELT